MKKGKKGGSQTRGRHKKKLSQSKSKIKTIRQVEHLDPESDLHGIDVVSACRLRAGAKAACDPLALGELLPAEAEMDLLESLYKGVVVTGSVASLPVIASGPRPDLVTTIWFGDAGVGNMDIDGHDGSPMVMEGKAWQANVLKSDEWRKNWRNNDGKLRKAVGMESLLDKKKANRYPWQTDPCEGLSDNLEKIFARLPPWLALLVSDRVNRDVLVELVRELAVAFQKETGRIVIGASIHVETAYDIHIHLIFTRLGSEIESHKHGPSYVPKVITKHQKAVKAKMIASGMADPTHKEVTAKRKQMYRDGLLEDPREPKCKMISRALKLTDRPMKSMGPAYCSKATLWEQSDRDSRVEAVNARAIPRVTFREIVVEKSKDSEDNPVSSEGVYIDFWLWRKWASLVEGLLDQKTRETLPEIARPYIERYVENGCSLPNPDLDAARKKAYGEVFDKLTETQQALAGPDTPPSTAASLDDLIDEIKGAIAEKELSVAEAALDIKKSFETLVVARDEIAGPDALPTEAASMPELVAEITGILKTTEQKNVTEAARLTLVAEETAVKKTAAETLQKNLVELKLQTDADRQAVALALENAQTAEQDALSKVAPIIADATKRQKAADLREEGLEFSALARARERIAGPSAPPSTATTVPEMVNDIDRILEAKVETKVQTGVAQALKRVFARVLKGKPVPASDSPQAVETGLMDGLLEIATGTALAAWKSVFGYFARKGEQPKGNTPEAVTLEVKELISGQVADDYQVVFDALGHVPPKNMPPNGFAAEVNVATKNFQDSEFHKVLVRVVQLVTEDEDPAFAELETSELTTMLHREIVEHKKGIKEAKENLVRSAIGDKEMENFRTPEDALNARVKKFDEIVTLCSTVVWGLNPEAEDLTDKVKKACQELRTLVGEVPAPAKTARDNALPAIDKDKGK